MFLVKAHAVCVGLTKVSRNISAIKTTGIVIKNKSMEKEMATHSSILAWKSPWTEEPGRLQSMGLHDWACVHEGGGSRVGSNKLVELKTKQNNNNKKLY